MKKSTKMKINMVLLRVVFCVILTVLYGLCLSFINDCNIQSDSYYFGLIGLACAGMMMTGIVMWFVFFDKYDKAFAKRYKKYITKEYSERKQPHIDRMNDIQTERLHKMFNELENSRKDDI